ncbi:AfsR/SARP family transcriptional regulator [Streptomyces gibsoniae]|uniref:AfsR/SARP family transcriptional regulator n=1 Tax=Streptomyces gibsoniae TaxID=3075529 RepID=A0ABU2U087_9ACTN|nr:AfsR/SARP family transcriptional regulator [Streptomyces sp. DSM 41699]MDT0466641.1 AfsR/SARP family transcriptional regulator [Streptomyces sp. DSM 41699]
MEKTSAPALNDALPEQLALTPTPGRPRFLVLGLLAITDGRETVVLQPSRPASLLAALLLHPGTVVSSGFLQQVVWGSRPPAGGKSALHTCVLRLRRLFAKYGISDHAIEAVPGGYRLHADVDTLDLLHFRALLAQASVSDDPETALRLAQNALQLWQEPLLANVQSDELHRDQVPRLAEERLLAVEQVFDGELRLGRHREMIAEARRAVHAHPGHEGLSALLIEALYRSGRRAEALAEYRRIHTHLAAELGVEPGPALRGLQLAVLRGDPPGGRPALSPEGALPAAPEQRTPGLGRASPATPGALVLRSLVDAGLLEEGPPGRYRVHDLLRLFAQAAGTTLSAAAPHGPTDLPPPAVG